MIEMTNQNIKTTNIRICKKPNNSNNNNNKKKKQQKISANIEGHLVSSIESSLVRDRRIALDLNDCLQFWKFVLDEQNSFEKILILNHDDVRLGIESFLGNLLGTQNAWLTNGDSSENKRLEMKSISLQNVK